MKTIIFENMRGALIEGGKFKKLLAPGKYLTFGNKKIVTFPIGKEAFAGVNVIPLSVMKDDPLFRSETTSVTVAAGQAVLHIADGAFFEFLTRPGTYYYWNAVCSHSFQTFDTTKGFVDDALPAEFCNAAADTITTIAVPPKMQAALYINKKFVKFLSSGVYRFWKTDPLIEVTNYPVGQTQLDIVGQEILTADKVTLRINCVCDYEIADAERLDAEINRYQDQLYTAVQLALREYVGKHRMDEILESKDELTAFLTRAIKKKGETLYLNILEVAVKDIILPGEIRDIMNTVLVAEKRAQANVISRREEVASTRSLLNTARLMDENETLYKLKQWEYVERICEKVGNINIGGGDLTSQLAELLGGNKKNK